jgi:hypothetical protein
MARKRARLPAPVRLDPLQPTGRAGGKRMRLAHHSHRTVTRFPGVTRLPLKGDRCRNPACPRCHQPTHPGEEGAWALPPGEFGWDVLALGDRLREQQQRRRPQLHPELLRRGLPVTPRTVTDQR